MLEQPAGGKQPAGSILYFQLHNLHLGLAQTSGLAEYRPPGKKPPLANIGQVARIGQKKYFGQPQLNRPVAARLPRLWKPDGSEVSLALLAGVE